MLFGITDSFRADDYGQSAAVLCDASIPRSVGRHPMRTALRWSLIFSTSFRNHKAPELIFFAPSFQHTSHHLYQDDQIAVFITKSVIICSLGVIAPVARDVVISVPVKEESDRNRLPVSTFDPCAPLEWHSHLTPIC